MARRSRSKQRSKGAGSRSSKAKSSGKSQGGSRSGGKSRSSSSKSKSSSSKSKSSSSSRGRSGAGTGGGQKSNPTKKAAPKKVAAPKAKAPAFKAKSPAPKAKKETPKKTLTKVQQRFKEREAQGLDGLTGMRKVTDAERKEGKTQLTQYRAAQKEQVQNAAKARNAARVTGIPSGDKLKAGSFGISEEGKALAAKQRAEAAAKKAAAEKARKAEEKRQRQFDPSRLLGGALTQTSAGIADNFAKPSFMYQGNPLSRTPGLSNYFSPDAGAAATYSRSGALKGIPFAGGSATGTLSKFKVPDGAKVGRSPLGIRQLKLNPKQMSQLTKVGTVAGDDVAKLAAKGLGKYGARAVPFAGAALSIGDAVTRVRDKDYTGAALAAASAIPGPVGLMALGGLAAKDISSAMNTSQQVASTQAGGLNIGSTGGVDSGEATSKTGRTLTARAKRPGFDTVLGAADFALNDRTDLDRRGTGLFGKGLVMPSDVVKDAGMVAGKIRNNELSIGDVKSGYRDIKNIVTSKDRLKTIGDMNTKDLTRLATKGYDVARDSAVVQTAGEKLGLPSDFKQQTDTLRDAVKDRLSSVKMGDRDSTYKAISDFNRDIGTDPKLSLAARQAEAFRSGEGTTMQKIAAGFQPGAAKAKGLSAAERGIIGSVGNRIISGKQTDIAREAMSGMKAGSSLTAGNLTGIAQNVIKNTAPGADTVSAKRASQIKSIVTGGRGRRDITPSSLIQGVNPFRGSNRGGGSTPIRSATPTFTPSGGGTPVGQVPQIPATGTVPQFQVPELPVQQGTDPSNLANIQNESYQSTFKNLMAINPNYSARFRMRRRGGRRGGFRKAFSRRFFS